MKRKAIAFLSLLLLPALAAGCGAANEEQYGQGAVRLHIVANSDSEYDQELKLSIRDRIVEEYAPVFASLESSEHVWEELSGLLEGIESSAREYLVESGADYGAEAVMGIYDFPKRSYMGEVWPAGQYRAVKVVLGDGAGQNWWCVLYPPLCFISEDEVQDAGEYYAQVEQYLAGGALPDAHVRSFIADKVGLGGTWDEMFAKWTKAYLKVMGRQ